LPSHLVSKIVNIKIFKPIILSVVLYEYGTWSVTPTEENRLSLFENRVLRRILGRKWGGGEREREGESNNRKKTYKEEFIIYTLRQILLGR
jgi:hypothetical protein